jgi:hypothetical protein
LWWRQPNANGDSYVYSNTDCYTDCYGDGYVYSYGDRYGYCNADGDSDGRAA